MKLALTLSALVCAFTGTATDAQTRRSDTGRFVVTGVLIDPALDNNEQRYFEDDPRFVGRLVDIAPNRLEFDGDERCTPVRRTWSRMTIAALLRAKLKRRSPNQRSYPSPADMGLARAPARPVDMVAYRCGRSDNGRSGDDWSDVSGFPLNAKERGLLWQGEVILVLTPVARAASARPSFDCRRARTANETTICRDPALAGWDRSVATAYKRLAERGYTPPPAGDDPGLVESQRQWLAERNRCGGNRACLKDQMATRTDQLMRGQYWNP